MLYERSAADGKTGDGRATPVAAPPGGPDPPGRRTTPPAAGPTTTGRATSAPRSASSRLTDGGGRLPDPGTRLTYDHAVQGFTITGTGAEGEPLAGAFDYVVAINYNRQAGTSPRDWTRPLGEDRGGGIWFHVDHDGPTQGCISLSKAHMRKLLRTLDPARHPVVVMGDAGSLAR